MQLIKYFFSNNLLIKSLLLSRNFHNIMNNYEEKQPIKHYSIKTIKNYYYQNNIYFDIYNDLCNTIKCNNNDCEVYDNDNDKKIYTNYFKFNDLTAEHIFPQSFTRYYIKANKDMHNIYLTNYYTNNYRSNYKFSDSLLKYNTNSSRKNKIYIPCNNSRGMISRSIAYMKYTYPLLNISYVIDYNDLITWNKLYPPSDYEILKNKVINKYQGNSNIFIENYKLLELYIKYLHNNNKY